MKTSTWWMVGGSVSLAGGVLALFFPVNATVVAEQVAAVFFVVASLFQLASVPTYPHAGSKVWAALWGVLELALGLYSGHPPCSRHSEPDFGRRDSDPGLWRQPCSIGLGPSSGNAWHDSVFRTGLHRIGRNGARAISVDGNLLSGHLSGDRADLERDWPDDGLTRPAVDGKPLSACSIGVVNPAYEAPGCTVCTP